MADLHNTFQRILTTVHTGVVKISGGRVGTKMMGMPVLLLTTTGRKSGQPRTTPLTYHTIGGAIVLVASNGGYEHDPQWYKNLVADPKVKITREGQTEEMLARTASAAEKDEWWPTITTTYKGYAGYAKKTTRNIPLVVVSPSA